MQKTVYSCNSCKKDIGTKPHVSLLINDNSRASGIALPPKSPGNIQSSGWMVRRFENYFVHLCDGTCAGKYFDALISAAVGKPVNRPAAKKK